jgi:uncharacterized membrane protein (DUF373 family)
MKVEDFQHDPLIRALIRVIHGSVRALAVLMTLVILWGVLDVVYVLASRAASHRFYLLDISDILATFGAFMAVLIAIEIFINITSYLRADVIHVKIVMATALMAVARKVIVLDFKVLEAGYVWALAAVVLATSVGYFLAVVYEWRIRVGLGSGQALDSGEGLEEQ